MMTYLKPMANHDPSKKLECTLDYEGRLLGQPDSSGDKSHPEEAGTFSISLCEAAGHTSRLIKFTTKRDLKCELIVTVLDALGPICGFI